MDTLARNWPLLSTCDSVSEATGSSYIDEQFFTQNNPQTCPGSPPKYATYKKTLIPKQTKITWLEEHLGQKLTIAKHRWLCVYAYPNFKEYALSIISIFINPSAWAGYDTRSIF